jgi:hypothetical protein
VTTQPPTHPWQTRGERLGEISLVLIGFTIPLSNALCTGVFPALAVMAWLMMRGWRGVPKLLRENRVALLCVALFAWRRSARCKATRMKFGTAMKWSPARKWATFNPPHMARARAAQMTGPHLAH